MALRGELDALKTRRRSVDPDYLHGLLERCGFRRRPGKGDHWVYNHPLRRTPLSIDRRKPLLPAYVSKAIRAMEEVIPDDA